MKHKDLKSRKILETLLKVSKDVSSSLNLEKVGNIILKQAKTVLGTDYSALFILDEDSHKLILIGAIGFKGDQIENLKILGSWEGINSEVVKNARPIIVNDIRKSPMFKEKRVAFSHEKFPLGAFIAVPLKTDSGIIGVLIVSDHKKKGTKFSSDDKKLLYTLANDVSIALVNAKLYKNMKNLFLNTITSLVTAVDAKDPYTHGHSERVARYAVAIGKEMKMSESSLEDLKLSGLLHDIGKIGISDAILSKKDALTNEERKKIHRHPTIGLRIVYSVIKSKRILGGISEHHEFYNGEGYPEHLRGQDISLAGRIVAVADTFDSLTTDRPYKKALNANETLEEIKVNSGTQFDPRVVNAFQKSFKKEPEFWLCK